MKDIIIIGAGPAGMTAAVYGLRAGKSVLVLSGRGYGGQIVNAAEIENYPAIPKISGVDFARQLYDQASALGAEFVSEKATGIEDQGDKKIVRTESGAYEGRAVVIAAGATNRTLGIEGESRLTGSGVSYCATCDGNFFRGRDVAVIGGGNTALEDAEVLSGIVNRVYLVHRRSEFRGEAAAVKRLESKANVEFVLDSVPEEIRGKFAVDTLTVKNVKTGEERELPVSGVFVAVGQVPENGDFANVMELDSSGYAAADESCVTRTPGVFAAGDCRAKKVRQLSTATADGAVAALAAVEYINGLG